MDPQGTDSKERIEKRQPGLHAPRGVPEETAKVLRGAFDEAVADEDFVEAMMNAFGGSEIRFLNAEEADQLFTENLEVMEQFSDRFESVAEELYAKYVD